LSGYWLLPDIALILAMKHHQPSWKIPVIIRHINKGNYMNHNIRDILFIVALNFLFNGSVIADENTDSATEQKAAIDHMHHQLHDDQAAYKAQEAQALKELNEMTIRDDVRLEDVFAKIDELSAAQNQILRLRYEHLIEMRKLLTDEQKIKYDQNVLNRSEIR